MPRRIRDRGGWFGESARHALAARGIRTSRDFRPRRPYSYAELGPRMDYSEKETANSFLENLHVIGDLILAPTDELGPEMKAAALVLRTLTGLGKAERAAGGMIRVAWLVLDNPNDKDMARQIAHEILDTGVHLVVPAIATETAEYCIDQLQGTEIERSAGAMGATIVASISILRDS